MIPLRLELTNFLSYRDTAVLDFENIHLACISGLNGAGKSSVLDAITWALFGRSRSKSDDDLVNRLAALGGNGADIKFTFSLEEIVYRVIRRKTPGKTSLLELQMEAGSNQWKTLSESGVRETQAALEKLLRMNYETFINASFLLQGKADEFTTKSPNRRKEILADLLGVSQWDQFREIAANRRKEAEGQLALHDGMLGEIESELAEEPERERAVEAAEEEMANIETRVVDKEAHLQQLRRAETAVKQQQQLVNNLADNLKRTEKTLSEYQQLQQQRQREREEKQLLLANKKKIVTAFAAWQEADAAAQSWQTRADQLGQLKQAQRPHEIAVARVRSGLEQRQLELQTQAKRAQHAAIERDAELKLLADGNERLQRILPSLEALSKEEQGWHDARAKLQSLEAERKLFAQELEQLRHQHGRILALDGEKKDVSANAKEAETMLAEVAARVAAISEQNKQFVVNRADIDSLNIEQKRLHEQMDELKGRIDQLEVDGEGTCPLCGQPLSEAHRLSVREELQGQGEKSAVQFRTNQERIRRLAEETAHLESAIKQGPRLERDHETQRERLVRAEARLGEIDQALDEWHSGNGPSRLQALASVLGNESPIAAQKQRVSDLEGAIDQKASLEEERRQLQRQVTTSETRIGEIERSVTQWREVGRAELAEVTSRLERKAYAIEDQQALEALQSQIEELGYDAAAHGEARQAKEELSGAPDEYQELRQVEAALEPLADALTDLAKQVADQERTVTDLAHQHRAATAELAIISGEGGDVSAVEDELFRLREEQVSANQKVGAAKQKLEVLAHMKERRGKLIRDRADVSLLIKRLKLLERACGRNGVQALLIEQAVPEIEERANELLERLTSGEMRVSIETQRQLKSRDATVETLDIRIVDSAGERPYSNFSGGEQFRVNFAIRLALSQILAKRAGARLQTLVIDEGFGSQDPNGRQRLVEAINVIQEDFARILVITHIDELRDAFPTRIEVEKGVGGSSIVVM
jgi:exonuclease SbcC